VKLQWSDTYSIGNKELDEQHKTWIELYNSLDAMMSSDNPENLTATKADVLQKMSDYVDYHFTFEEDYMREIGFSEIDRHWRMHKDFRTRIYRICRDHQEGTIVLSSEVMDTIRNWLVDHIVKQDIKIMDFLSSQEGGR